MNIFYIIIILVFVFGGILMVITGLPGTFLTWLGILLTAAINGFEIFSVKILIILFLAALMGEGLEFLSGMIGAKRYGASAKGTTGAILGGMTGGIIITPVSPGLGTIFGVIGGTFAGAFIGETLGGKTIMDAGKAGWGALIGRVIAIAIKVLLILGMGSYALAKYFYF